MKGTATISPCGAYRYILRRIWDDVQPHVYWLMLNPSTADDRQDDPTIRRCISFSRSWGFGSLTVMNIFAYRATDPEDMRAAKDPIGPRNDDTLRSIPDGAEIIAAWGTHGEYLGRGAKVRTMLHGRLRCLGQTSTGHPKHPLYVKGDTARVGYA